MFGDRGPAVATAEKDLAKLGYYHGPIDGIFGPEVQSAVESFQTRAHLKVTGKLGPRVWNALGNAVSPPQASLLLKPGMVGPAVKDLQTLLDQVGNTLPTDGHYGPLTTAAVTQFQRTHGITPTGNAGPKTMAALEAAVEPKNAITAASTTTAPAGYLYLGSKGPKIVQLQTQLNELGFSTGGEDGVYGPHTLAAVIAFQKTQGLPDHGFVGALTFAALKKALTPVNTNQVSRGGISSTAMAVIGLALKYRGWRYVWGGASPATGFDCSGYTQWIFGQFGVSLPRTSFAQWNAGPHVEFANLAPGDLVFFTTYGVFANHVGIYLGNGQFISAATPGQGVIVQNLDTAFWQSAFDGGVNVLGGS